MVALLVVATARNIQQCPLCSVARRIEVLGRVEDIVDELQSYGVLLQVDGIDWRAQQIR